MIKILVRSLLFGNTPQSKKKDKVETVLNKPATVISFDQKPEPVLKEAKVISLFS